MSRALLQLREKRLQRTCALNLGAAYVEAGEPQKGLDVLSRAQPGERGERIADLQFNLATAHEALGEQTQAARHYLQAAQLYRSQGAAAAEGDTCVRLARCHLQRKVCDGAAHTDVTNVTENNDVDLHAEFCIYLILCIVSEVKQLCVCAAGVGRGCSEFPASC